MNSSTTYDSLIVNLNVGGTRFSTSKETLTWIPDSFFSSLLSGRIPSHRDENGAIFVDRDPKYFGIILAFLRTRELDVRDCDIESLKREAEFYGISPIVSRLSVCTELNKSGCGTNLFHGIIEEPHFPHSATDSGDGPPDAGATNSACNNFEELELVPDVRKVLLITGHSSWIAVAYKHFVVCYKMKENFGWQQVFASPHLQYTVERIAINAKVQGMAPDTKTRMVAIGYDNQIRLWSFQDENNSSEIGTFNLQSPVDSLFFIGSQLVATSRRGRVGVWNAVSQHWQAQDVVPITSYDTAGSFLLLGGQNGGIYYIDMQKFPLRLKDNDLLITELYTDTSNEAITALSVYLTPKTSVSVGNWIEVAYGTVSGAVRVIVQHPELVGQGFQLFQTFTVHRSPVTRVMLSEKFLVSVCGDNNHVRTWNVTRFRGMISTQPGSTPVASFKVLSIEADTEPAFSIANDIGPHGEREEEQVFIQKVVPVSSQLYVRLSSTGKRIATINSVDDSIITCFCLHECDGSTRMGSRPRRYLFTGHSNGNIQIWDMTTALQKAGNIKVFEGGPTEHELLQLLNHCDVSSSACNRSSVSIAPSLLDRVLLRSSMTSLDSFHSSNSGTLKRSNQTPLKKINKSTIVENTTAESSQTSMSTSFSARQNANPPLPKTSTDTTTSKTDNTGPNKPQAVESKSQLVSSPTQRKSITYSLSFSNKTNKSESDKQSKSLVRTTSFSSTSITSPPGGVPLPGMTFSESGEGSSKISKVKKDKSEASSSQKKKHSRSRSLTEQQCAETSSASVKREFSLKLGEKSSKATDSTARSNTYAHSVKKKPNTPESIQQDQSKPRTIHESSLTPRNSTSRNSYKSAIQQEPIIKKNNDQ